MFAEMQKTQRRAAPDTSRERPRRAWRVALAALGVLVLVCLVVGQPIARWQTRRWLSRLHGIQGDFLDARVSLFPLAYSVTHLKLSQPERQTPEPLLYAEELSMQLLWGQLLRGRLVTRVRGNGVKVVLEQPAPGAATRLPDLSSVFPLRVVLQRVDAKKGEVLYVWVHQKGQPTMWFHDIEATLENVASRPELQVQEMTLAATGIVQEVGRMSVVVQAKPYALPLSFRGEASLDGFDVSQMNALIDSQKGVKLSPGPFSMRMVFDSENGRLKGRVEPVLRDSHVVAQDASLGSAVTALLGSISMVIAPQADGTTASGTILVRDELTEPDRQLLPSMEKVVENGFLLGLQESLRRRYTVRPVDSAEKKPAELHTGK
jgi:Domain of Unknown Function (DUF748)